MLHGGVKRRTSKWVDGVHKTFAVLQDAEKGNQYWAKLPVLEPQSSLCLGEWLRFDRSTDAL